ncbi:flagellar hook-length control protein FliK [Sulfurospirillum sp. hDNRA2]|uniref:flagellar hook-length control protein FliK n=1 Tax=Sulfurospirillum sp. hDNRA2 TaxID=3237298 RepID=UPI0020B673D7|nr:flagellar hook-length control protein FliK [Sulfurospirillum sp. DNRA8]MCP3652456.1 flagellar hook-length control protein FliK [Sulfurospirillum sp. DNRA8]MCR1811307.1 flagellar hook-length control protein FliK [Sulfurospirillum sp. DNRA8]
MDVNTASLLANQLQTLDTKTSLETKEALTRQADALIQKSAQLPLELSSEKTAYAKKPSDAKEVVAQLLGSAISEVKSKSAIYEVLQKSQLFKNMGNFADDIKTLTTTTKLDSTIAQPMALLQLFTKNIDQIDTKMLQTQIQNSGIFFESKLANTLKMQGASDTLETLRTHIQTHLDTPLLQTSPITKEISAVLDLLAASQDLSSKEAQSNLKTLLDLFRQGVKQVLAEPSMFKEAYQIAQKLEYAIKQTDLIASKVENYPASMKVEEHFNTQVKVLLEQLKENLSELGLNDLEPQIDELLLKGNFLQEIVKSLKSSLLDAANTMSMPKTPVSAMQEGVLLQEHTVEEPMSDQEVTASSVQNSSVTAMPLPSSSAMPQSVEEALKMLANRIKQQIEVIDPQTVRQAEFNAKSSTLDQTIHALIKPELFVGKTLAQKLQLDPSDVELLSDIKGVLTKLNEAFATSPQNKEAYEITNRLLTQIEYHQLFSYVSSSTHVYIPFSWEGMKNGSMMMKQSTQESFHCQIDLDLEYYGKINMMLVLSNDKYVDMNVAVQKSELKKKIGDQLPKLKRALNEVGLITGMIKMLEYKDVSAVKNDYFSGEQIEFGINLKI